MGLATKTCQDAVDVLNSSVVENELLDGVELQEFTTLLHKVCDLLCLDDDFTFEE
tara:strand:+ start:235 stop:399 length:165 start_codon:yes stop_codon:yes gene_type:complete